MTDTATRVENPGDAGAPPPVTVPDADESWSGRWLTTVIIGVAAVVAVLFFGFIALAMAFTDPGEEAVASTIDVTMSEFAIDGALTAPAGDVTLRIANLGNVAHNINVRGTDLASGDVGPGGGTELALGDLGAGSYELFCSIAGHEASGMVSTLTVTDDGSGAAAAPAGDHSGHGGSTVEEFAAMDQAMMDSMLAFPAETEGRGNPVLEPTEVLSDGTKVFDLTASIVDWEVEPGKIVQAWTYNGVVPAPQILLDRDDKVKVRVVNNLPLGTDIHWHGVRVPNSQDGVSPLTQPMIEPNGGTFEYNFVADEDAIAMYHAHVHGHLQVVNGMFGTIRIGENPIPRGMTVSGVTIPEDLETVADFPMVLNDAGTIGLSLNGKSFPATEPLAIKQGDWVSVTYYNEGLTSHPMHLHQFPQLVYAKDGLPLDEPYWVDTLNVAPGERYTVLFNGDSPGAWVWHCHILNHVERETGMFGMVTAVLVEEDPGFDPADKVSPANFQWSPATAASDAASAAIANG